MDYDNFDSLFDGKNHGQDHFYMTVTPELARRMLTFNNHNRPLYSHTVNNYARQMMDNRWYESGVPLLFGKRGLIDGQHRLSAIVRSGKSFRFLICVNQDDKIHMIIDNGLKRSGLDNLRQGLQNQSLKGKHLSVLKAAVAGRFCYPQNHLNSIELQDIFNKIGETVIFAVDKLGKKTDTTMLAVFVRACCNLPDAISLGFAEAWKKKEFAPIVAFQRFLDTCEDRSMATKREIYKRFYFTIQAFVNQQETVSYPIYWNDLFALPR